MSSGIDSSYVASYFPKQKAFTVGFDFGEKYNEISWAKRLAPKIDVEHHYKIISSDEKDFNYSLSKNHNDLIISVN